MSRVIVSILSNHSMPNFLFLKEMEGKYDEFLFVSTPEVDKLGRESQLINALGVDEDKGVCVIVDGNDYKSIMLLLADRWEVRKGDEYIVNLTGGTKMMSLAVHDFFAPLDAQFYYVPIGKNTYYNLTKGEWKPLAYRANLKEYFALYGIRYESTKEGTLQHTRKETNKIFEEVKQRKFRLPLRLIRAQEADSHEMRSYLAGEWFEQYCYFSMKSLLNLDKEHIALSLKIYREKSEGLNDNELDVAFMLNNELNVIECKVTMNGMNNNPKAKAEEYLYKLAAISKDFGLQVNSYLFTLHRMNRLKPESLSNLKKRCRILGIRGIVSGDVIQNYKANYLNK